MKAKIRLLVIVLLTVALLTALFPMTGLAKGNKTYFTGTECFGEITDMGTWTPLGNGYFRVTGLHSWHTDTTTDPRLTGIDNVVVNAVANPDTGNGTFHGTFEIVNNGGSWFGHWVGKQENGNFTIEGLTHGSGGYDGLVANWHYSPETDENGCNLTSGYIVETGGGH
jgi:hypothetical protein